MNRFRGSFAWLLLRALPLLLLLAAPGASAALSASVDRAQVALGDTLRLTITATGGEELSDAVLAPLQRDFDILQRATSSNTRIVNGQRTSTRQLVLDITPLREGKLEIPAIRVGNAQTAPVRVNVAPPPEIADGSDPVLFEAELDRDSVYVQGQLILTLRVQQSINLEDRGVSQLDIDGAFIRELEQKSFYRNIDGRQWLVLEVRYAIFPEESGVLEIPAQQFTGRVREPRRDIFDFGRGGRLLRRSTEPLQVEVLPRPDNFPGDNWLPARQVRLEEEWSTPPEQLQAGESATRSIRIVGEGVQGAQLPPVLFTPLDGLKFYPDQPEVRESEVATGLLGFRQDSAAVVATRAGNWTIPEIRVPWWDTEHRELRYAVLPARQLTVTPAASSPSATAIQPQGVGLDPDPAGSAGSVTDQRLWQGVALACGIGWLLTLWLLLRRRSEQAPVDDGRGDERTDSERQARKRLLQACRNNRPDEARDALIHWARARHGDRQVTALRDIAALDDDAALARQLDILDRSLYSATGSRWNGSDLAACIQALPQQPAQSGRQSPADLALYPRSG